MRDIIVVLPTAPVAVIIKLIFPCQQTFPIFQVCINDSGGEVVMTVYILYHMYRG